MALRFVMSGGNFIFTAGQLVPGIWLNAEGGLTASAPAGRANTYAHTSAATNVFAQTPNLGGNFAGLIAGFALWFTPVANNVTLLAFLDNSGNSQTDVRMNGSGQLFFTRNGTVIGGPSTFAMTPGAWSYLEFKALFSTAGTGTCEVRVNGVVVLSSTGLTNATTTATAAMAFYGFNFGPGSTSYATDFHALDTISGANVSYLGDVSIVEAYADGPGVHSAWADSPAASFSITSVANASGGNTVYTGTITNGASNALVGYNFTPNGFAHSQNNVGGSNPAYFECVASTATTITLNNPNGVADTTGTMPFQCIVQSGAINQTGNRPNGDTAYIFDNNPGDISDFAHTAVTLPAGGVILGVVHHSYLRKDNAGTRTVAQVCLSGSATEQGATVSLGNTYEYFKDILETDPNTSAQFTLSGLNSATFGIKEIS